MENNKKITEDDRVVDSYEKHLDIFQTMGGNSDGTGVWNQEESAFLSLTTLKSLFFSEDWVFIVNDLIASELSSVPINVMKKETVNGEEILTAVQDHPLQQLLDNPNEWQDYSSFIYNLNIEKTLMGNSVVWFNRSSNQIMVVPFDKLNIDFDQFGAINTYSVIEENEFGGKTVVSEFKPKDIMHIRRPNPNSLIFGLSPFIPGRKSVLFNRYTTEYLNSFYEKGATPGLAIKMDKAVSEKAALRLLRSYEMAYTGRRNQRRTLVLPKGTDVSEISHTIADQRITELVNANMDKVLNLLGVPKHALSMAEAGSLGSEEAKTALRYFWTSRLIPSLKSTVGSFNKFFKKELGDDHIFQEDLSQVEALKENEIMKADLADKMLKTHTLNEVRSTLYSLPPLLGGDSIVNPSSFAPSPRAVGTRVDVEPEDKPIDIEEEEIPEAEEAEEDAVDEFEGFDSDEDKQKALRVASLLDYKERRSIVGRIITKQDDETERTLRSMMKLNLALFLDMSEAALDVIGDSFREVKDAKPSVTNEILRQRISKAFGELEADYTGNHAKQLSETVELSYKEQLGLVFNDDARDAITAIGAREQNKRRTLLEARGVDTFKNLSKTRTDRIMDLIGKGLDEKDTIAEISRTVAEGIAGKRGDPFSVLGQAETIARTETLTAFSIGQKAAMDNTATVIPDLRKAWITANDDRVRGNPGGKYPNSKANHWELQTGETIPHDEPFPNGLDYPRDTKGDPSETINCRCVLLIVSPQDEDDLNIPSN